MAYLASDLYGGPQAVQPTASPAPSHAPGPQPMARTVARPGANPLSNPTMLLVALLGVAILLIHASVGFEFRISK